MQRYVAEEESVSALNFDNANLEGANLENADLGGVSLVGALLAGAALAGAMLRRADLREAVSSEATLAGANLVGANLREANLARVDLEGANLGRANLCAANLQGANLEGADLERANLPEAHLDRANLRRANLDGANLRRANLVRANLCEAGLAGADLAGANLDEAILGNLRSVPDSLSEVDYLQGCVVDWRTVTQMLMLPDPVDVLCRTGMPHVTAVYTVDSLRSIDETDLFNLLQSVFLSFGTPDQEFAERLRNELTKNGVKTWYYPRSAEPGQRHHSHIHGAIWEYDKLLLCCSRESIFRLGVLHEVGQVLQREQQEGNSVRLIPILLSEGLFESGSTPPDWWARKHHHIYRVLQGRVCARFYDTENNPVRWNEEFGKVLAALRKHPEDSD